MITLKVIKNTVESFANVDDISTKSRKRPLPDYRYTYYGLCEYFKVNLKQPTLENIAKEINRDHSTACNGLKQFKNLYGKKYFNGNDVYNKSLIYLNDFIEDSEIPEEVKREELLNVYRIKHVKTSEKYRNTINSLTRKLNTLRSNELINKITKLNDEDLKELEIKLDAFFKVKKL